jgi:hypothetical protein
MARAPSIGVIGVRDRAHGLTVAQKPPQGIVAIGLSYGGAAHCIVRVVPTNFRFGSDEKAIISSGQCPVVRGDEQ